jgi:osmoprotectant transport system substrate-binding protein
LTKFTPVRSALSALSGRVADDDMRRLNHEVDGKRRDVAAVVKEFRSAKRL